jgi:hypothetical protein
MMRRTTRAAEVRMQAALYAKQLQRRLLSLVSARLQMKGAPDYGTHCRCGALATDECPDDERRDVRQAFTECILTH